MTKPVDPSPLPYDSLARLFELHPDATFVCDAEGIVAYANGAARRLTDRDVAGEPIDIALGLEVSGGLGEVALERRHRSGVWLELLAASSGDLVAVVARDITKRKNQEERLALALEAGKMGTWEWELDGNRVVWSPNLEALHGHPPGTFDGTFEFYLNDIHPDDRDAVLGALSRSTETGVDFAVEYRLVWPDGSVHWTDARGRVIRDSGGAIIGLTGLCLETTEQKRSQSAVRMLEEANARLVEVDRMKDEFLGGLSTQLSSPLNAIHAFADVLDGGALGSLRDEQREYLGRIRASSEVMLASVNELLDLSRITAGRFQLDSDRVRLDLLIQSVVSTLAPLAKMQGLRVLTISDEAVELEEADAARLEQVVMQLLYGAVRLAPSGGMIRIALAIEDGVARFEASHAGAQISEANAAKVFSTVAQFGGTWLGFAVPKRIVEAHGGEIGIEAESSGGNTFWFTVPLRGPRGGRR